MSDPTVTDSQSRHRPSRRFARMIAAAVTMSAFGLSAGAGLAHADSVVTFTGPAGPVPVDTAFTYTVEIPNTGPDIRDQSTEVNITLSGAAATFTAAQPSQYWECETQTTSVYCFDTGNRGYPVTITLTVLPTAAGTVTAQAVAKSAYDGTPNGTGSISTQVGQPAFPFAGFHSPVNNTPTVNTVNAGRSIPIKFSLGGDRGLNILAAGSPTSRQTACGGGSVDPVETTTTSNSGLSYDAATDVYTYVWKTDKAWTGTCRTFHLALSDGTDHTADFQFK